MNPRAVRNTAIVLGLIAFAIYIGYIAWIGYLL